MSELSNKRLLVTGASGYIGSRLCEMALEDGAELVVLGRRSPKIDGVEFVPFELGQDIDPSVIQGVDAVVHLAAADLENEDASDLNITGSKILIDAAKSASVKTFIYTSSQSAREDAPTKYGRDKWAVEGLFGPDFGIILRPGFVYGRDAKGAYGNLCSLLAKFPIIPIIGADEPVQPIYIDDLCHAILQASTMPSAIGHMYNLGAEHPIRFETFLKQVARAKFARRSRVVKVPLTVALTLAEIARALPGLPNIHSDRLKGLQNIQIMDSAENMAALNLIPKELELALSSERPDNQKRLYQEGSVLLEYITGNRPTDALVERYVQALSVIEDHRVLLLPALIKRIPRLLRLMDPIKKNVASPGLLADRLEIASRLAEATTENARQFMNLKSRSLPSVGVELALIGMVEVLAFPFRFLFSRNER